MNLYIIPLDSWPETGISLLVKADSLEEARDRAMKLYTFGSQLSVMYSLKDICKEHSLGDIENFDYEVIGFVL